MKSFLRVLFAVAVFALSCHADIIYNTFGPDYGVGDSVTAILGGQHYEAMAAPFTPSSDVTVTQIDLGLYAYGDSNNFVINLMSDANGIPGSIIQSWNLQVEGSYQEFISTVQANAPLQGGHQYWVAVLPGDSQTAMGWFDSYEELLGVVGFDNGKGWYAGSDCFIPALDVIGSTAVPEPGTLCLLCTGGGLGIAGLVRRKL